MSPLTSLKWARVFFHYRGNCQVVNDLYSGRNISNPTIALFLTGRVRSSACSENFKLTRARKEARGSLLAESKSLHWCAPVAGFHTGQQPSQHSQARSHFVKPWPPNFRGTSPCVSFILCSSSLFRLFHQWLTQWFQEDITWSYSVLGIYFPWWFHPPCFNYSWHGDDTWSSAHVLPGSPHWNVTCPFAVHAPWHLSGSDVIGPNGTFSLLLTQKFILAFVLSVLAGNITIIQQHTRHKKLLSTQTPLSPKINISNKSVKSACSLWEVSFKSSLSFPWKDSRHEKWTHEESPPRFPGNGQVHDLSGGQGGILLRLLQGNYLP